MNRGLMATALRGTKVKGKVKRRASVHCSVCGPSRRTICAGRRRPWLATSALTMHASRNVSSRGEQEAGADRAQRHRQGLHHSKRMKEKRAVLDGVAAELQRIIAEPVQHREVARRLAA